MNGKKDLKYLRVNEEFKHVYEYDKNGKVVYQANIQINRKSFKSFHDTARVAAIEIDKILLRHQKQPVNVLKRLGGS